MATVLEGEGVSEEWMREQLGEWLATQGGAHFYSQTSTFRTLI